MKASLQPIGEYLQGNFRSRAICSMARFLSGFMALRHVGQWGSLGKHSLQTRWPLTHCFIGGVMWSKQTGHSRSWSSSLLSTVPKAAPSISIMIPDWFSVIQSSWSLIGSHCNSLLKAEQLILRETSIAQYRVYNLIVLYKKKGPYRVSLLKFSLSSTVFYAMWKME